MIKGGMPPEGNDSLDVNPLMLYTDRISMIRAFIYSCTSSDTNTNVFNEQNFMVGCNRFSVENPFPSVTVRCGLYGNTRDIMMTLLEAEKKYGKPNIKIAKKGFSSTNMGIPERLKPKNSAMRKANLTNVENSMDTGSEDSEFVEERRKPTIEVNETPRYEIKRDKEHINDLKSEFVKKMENKNEDNIIEKDSASILAAGVKVVIQKFKKRVEKKAENASDEESDQVEEEIKGVMGIENRDKINKPTKSKVNLTGI